MQREETQRDAKGGTAEMVGFEVPPMVPVTLSAKTTADGCTWLELCTGREVKKGLVFKSVQVLGKPAFLTLPKE